jgi:hypothetical protein
MLTYNELVELRDKLVKGEIPFQLVKTQFWENYQEGQRSWHTKDWKERRSKFLKDKCEICSSKDILTVQHRSHPRKFSEYKVKVTREHAREYINSNPVIDKSELNNHILRTYDYDPILLCPSCKSKNPNKRVRKIPKFRCADCKHEFDEAIFRTLDELVSIFYEDEYAYEVRDKCFITRDKWRNKHNLSSVRYWLQRERAKNKDAETIEKEAFLNYLDDNIKYLSFEDAITACRKCAGSYDMFKMELCPKCSTCYKGIQYPTCIQCLPEDKRKAALESIEFGKKWRTMHKELGID